MYPFRKGLYLDHPNQMKEECKGLTIRFEKLFCGIFNIILH